MLARRPGHPVHGARDAGKNDMTESVLAQAIGSFAEQAPSACLRASFAAVWVHRMDPTGAPPIVVMPDATIDLEWIGGGFRIAGPDKEPKTEVLAANEVVVGLRFHPAAAAAWLGVPLIELVGQRIPLDDLWGSRARRLASRIRVEGGVESLVAGLERAVAAQTTSRQADRQMQAAYGLIERGAPRGAPLVPWLMRALAMSERTLRRRFDESFGYGPKTLDRILRYQRFLQLAHRWAGSTAILAAEAGYSDQAHLVRESRRLTGRTPRQMHRLLQRA